MQIWSCASSLSSLALHSRPRHSPFPSLILTVPCLLLCLQISVLLVWIRFRKSNVTDVKQDRSYFPLPTGNLEVSGPELLGWFYPERSSWTPGPSSFPLISIERTYISNMWFSSSQFKFTAIPGSTVEEIRRSVHWLVLKADDRKLPPDNPTYILLIRT